MNQHNQKQQNQQKKENGQQNLYRPGYELEIQDESLLKDVYNSLKFQNAHHTVGDEPIQNPGAIDKNAQLRNDIP